MAYLTALSVVVLVYGAVPFLSVPTLGQAVWTSGFAESFVNGGWPSIKATNFGLRDEAPIAFGLAGAFLQSLFIRVFDLHAADAYSWMALVWLALALWGAIGFCQLLGTSFPLGAFLSLLYLTLPIIWRHDGYSMLSFGFALLPLYLNLSLRVNYFLPDPGRSRWKRSAFGASFLAVSLLAVFMDGYTFVMFFSACGLIWLVAFIREDVPRKVLITQSLPVVLVSAFVSYSLYSLYVGVSEFTAPPMSFFRGWGVDLAMFVFPSAGVSWLWDTLGVSVSRTDKEFFGDASVWMSTFSLPLILVGGLGYFLSRRTRFAAPLVLVALMGFYFSLGPSLKVGSTRPLDVNGEPLVEGVLMPKELAVGPTGSALIYNHVPGFRNMRATYRWAGLMLAALFGLSVLFFLGASSRGYTWIAAVVVALLIASNLPDLSARAKRSINFRKAFDRIDSDFSGLSSYVGQGAVVLFAPPGNDFLANYISSIGEYRTYNIGGDKNLEMAWRQWPDAIRAFSLEEKGDCFDFNVGRALQSGAADFVVIPYFDMLWGAHNWPPSLEALGERRDRFSSTITYFEDQPDFSVADRELYAVICRAPGREDTEPVAGYKLQIAEPVAVSALGCEYETLLTEGWNGIESWGAWSTGSATISVGLPQECRETMDCRLRLSFHLLNATPLTPKTLLIGVEGSPEAEWVINSGEPLERLVPLPREQLRGDTGEVRIRVRVVDAASPASLGLSGDARTLGLGLHELEVLEGGFHP
ncbi:MAG: hypothetical protein U9Q81_03270 [Pseudomonadota bacterium]|nr:hypothetical protein [Pseudomonadota bacterium]